MEKAYMIRNDGKAIPVQQHLYGNIDEITETLYAGEWLFENTKKSSIKSIFIDLIANYAAFYENLTNVETLIQDLKAKILGYPYKYLSTEFIDAHSGAIIASFNKALETGGKSEMQSLMREVIDDLNQEFLRARYGGMYNTSNSSREMVFRISSTGFNWYKIIWHFVFENETEIDTVTIVRDEEATGVMNGFYRAKDGQEYNQYPKDEFLMEPGNPVVESRDMVKNFLQKGHLVSELGKLPMNTERAKYRYKCLAAQENKQRVF